MAYDELQRLLNPDATEVVVKAVCLGAGTETIITSEERGSRKGFDNF